jgi:hypothetical protein
MTVRELYKIAAALVSDSDGDLPVMVDTATFHESENGTVFEVGAVKLKYVQGTDDSGPVGEKCPMVVITGPIEWHAHGDPI